MVQKKDIWKWFCEIIGRPAKNDVPKAEITAVVTLLDTNNDKYISWEEFHKFVNDKLLLRLTKAEKAASKKAGKK